jgi:hypothetical protein
MRGTSGRCPPPRASRDRGEYPPHSVLSSARLRSLGFCLSKAFRPFIGPIEPGFTRARHEPAIGATKILPAPKSHGSPWQRTARAERSARFVGLRQSLVSHLMWHIGGSREGGTLLDLVNFRVAPGSQTKHLTGAALRVPPHPEALPWMSWNDRPPRPRLTDPANVGHDTPRPAAPGARSTLGH